MTERKIDNDEIWKAQVQQMQDEGIARSKKQRDRLELSATNAAHKLKVEVIEQVADALTQIINRIKPQGWANTKVAGVDAKD